MRKPDVANFQCPPAAPGCLSYRNHPSGSVKERIRAANLQLGRIAASGAAAETRRRDACKKRLAAVKYRKVNVLKQVRMNWDEGETGGVRVVPS